MFWTCSYVLGSDAKVDRTRCCPGKRNAVIYVCACFSAHACLFLSDWGWQAATFHAFETRHEVSKFQHGFAMHMSLKFYHVFEHVFSRSFKRSWTIPVVFVSSVDDVFGDFFRYVMAIIIPLIL